MRITSWNYLHGQRIIPASDKGVSEILTELGSSVLAVQEIDMSLPRSGSINQVAEIAGAQGDCQWGFAPTLVGTPGFSWRALSADEKKVFTASNSPLENSYGIGIISTVPVREWLRLELGKAWIGLPLLVANEKGKVAPFYVKDEPRVAIAAVLENGWTVINLHLSFVPFVNLFQLWKVSRWAKEIEVKYSTKVAIVGDFNLPWGIPEKVTKFKRATQSKSYPSWKPSIDFDYILLSSQQIDGASEVIAPNVPISDHRPLSVDIRD